MVAAKKTVALSALERLAVSKAFDGERLKKDGTRESIKPGKFAIDTTVRIHGTIKVAEDTEAFDRYDAPLDIALLKLLRGFMDDDEIVKALPTKLRQAHDLGKEKCDKLLGESGINTVCDNFKAKINLEAGKQPRKGAVTATLFVEPA